MLKVKRIFAVLFFALLLSVVNVEVYKVQANNDPLYGFSIKQPLSVYESPSRNSEVLKQYNYNSSLKFKKYSEQWYVVTVYISGVAYKGYINKADVAEDKDI